LRGQTIIKFGENVKTGLNLMSLQEIPGCAMIRGEWNSRKCCCRPVSLCFLRIFGEDFPFGVDIRPQVTVKAILLQHQSGRPSDGFGDVSETGGW
jgi:hypothetical protein